MLWPIHTLEYTPGSFFKVTEAAIDASKRYKMAARYVFNNVSILVTPYADTQSAWEFYTLAGMRARAGLSTPELPISAAPIHADMGAPVGAIWGVAEAAIKAAKLGPKLVSFEFNTCRIIAAPNDSVDDICNAYAAVKEQTAAQRANDWDTFAKTIRKNAL